MNQQVERVVKQKSQRSTSPCRKQITIIIVEFDPIHQEALNKLSQTNCAVFLDKLSIPNRQSLFPNYSMERENSHPLCWQKTPYQKSGTSGRKSNDFEN